MISLRYSTKFDFRRGIYDGVICLPELTRHHSTQIHAPAASPDIQPECVSESHSIASIIFTLLNPIVVAIFLLLWWKFYMMKWVEHVPSGVPNIL